MFLDSYFTESNGRLTISRDQASRFAKNIANDFNPLHDADAKRFCVPGDLLFALVLQRYGLSPSMTFKFVGMVTDSSELDLQPTDALNFAIQNSDGKAFVDIERSPVGQYSPELIEAFTRDYVAFSGRNFPHILVPLLQKNGVMINPTRPMVMYESMSFDLEDQITVSPKLNLSDATLSVDGKRGEAELFFDVMAGNTRVGKGKKRLLISGLKPYEDEVMKDLCDGYLLRQETYVAA